MNRFVKFTFSLTVLIITLTSCGNDKKNKIDNQKVGDVDLIENTKSQLEEGLVLHLAIDSTELLGEYSGVYVSNRLNEEYGAIQLDGRKDYILEVDDNKLNPGEALTVSLWYEPSTFKGSGADALISKGFDEYKTPYYQYHLGVIGNESNSKSAGSFSFAITTNGKLRSVTSDSDTWIPGVWYHVLGVYDGRRIKLYVNGELKGESAAKGSISNFNQDLYIGRLSNREKFTPGKYDDIRIYDRALSLEDIQQISNNR